MQMQTHDEDRSRFIVVHFEISKMKNYANSEFAKYMSDVDSDNFNFKSRNTVSVAKTAARTDDFSTWHKIFNGNELNRDGKVNFLISGDASLPAASVESAGKGNTELLISVIYLAASQTNPRLIPKYPANPFPQSRTLETSHLSLGRSSRLTLIQLKTSDRAKQRRIDHENFN